MRDYHDQVPYDRKWIYRAIWGEAIVDIIWSRANSRTDLDAEWISRGASISIEGEAPQP
jgi:hypothetical protein